MSKTKQTKLHYGTVDPLTPPMVSLATKRVAQASDAYRQALDRIDEVRLAVQEAKSKADAARRHDRDAATAAELGGDSKLPSPTLPKAETRLAELERERDGVVAAANARRGEYLSTLRADREALLSACVEQLNGVSGEAAPIIDSIEALMLRQRAAAKLRSQLGNGDSLSGSAPIFSTGARRRRQRDSLAGPGRELLSHLRRRFEVKSK
jgi:hypothetical protein